MTLLHDKFSHQEKYKQNILNKHSKNNYLFVKNFYFVCSLSTQFTDFASLKIQMQITFADNIKCSKQHSLVSVVNKNFDLLIIL